VDRRSTIGEVRLLGSLAIFKGLLFILTVIGFGIAYLVMGNTPGRFVGIGLIVLGAALGFRMA
jgi:hypothetical protein